MHDGSIASVWWVRCGVGCGDGRREERGRRRRAVCIFAGLGFRVGVSYLIKLRYLSCLLADFKKAGNHYM